MQENEQDFSPAQWPGLPDPKNPTYANYTEKLEVGYRYYDAHKIQVLIVRCACVCAWGECECARAEERVYV